MLGNLGRDCAKTGGGISVDKMKERRIVRDFWRAEKGKMETLPVYDLCCCSAELQSKHPPSNEKLIKTESLPFLHIEI